MCSSSFLANSTRATNRSCYAVIRDYSPKITASVIIEQSKMQRFGKTFVEEYLIDLQEMGLAITFEYDKKNKEYIVNVDKLTKPIPRKALFMAIRYLWESDYTVSDQFHHILEGYQQAKALFTKSDKFTKLELMCLAHNYALLKLNSYFNTNHMWCKKNGCRTIKDLNVGGGDINDFMTPNVQIITHAMKISAKWQKPFTKKMFLELYKRTQ
jgi:hypothetical protein